MEGVVCADKHMDMVSNRELGVDVHDVVGDGDCLLHAWIKASESNEDLPFFFRTVTGLRDGLAKFFESHASKLERYHAKYGVWPWHRPRVRLFS
eukprot:COSAG02_NODE_1445_length_12580_cov_8.848089_4_plen_94_part_00